MNSVRDKILTRVLINERLVEGLKVAMPLFEKKEDKEDLKESFKELSARIMCREFEYFNEKARDVLALGNVLEEASKFIKEPK